MKPLIDDIRAERDSLAARCEELERERDRVEGEWRERTSRAENEKAAAESALSRLLAAVGEHKRAVSDLPVLSWPFKPAREANQALYAVADELKGREASGG